ncbi:MAG: FAD-dependent oxidoreductase [Planctomycetaceae bacterium]
MQINRRELIALMLGTPALLEGCALSSRLPPAGDLFGQSASVGHRLRDGLRPQPSDGAWKDVSVVIVGGGAAGLSAAWRLKQGGLDDFQVLELEPAAGGTSRSGKCELTPYPWGAHYIPVPFATNTRLINLLDEMGIVESIAPDGSPVIGEQYLCREPEERLFFQGSWIEGLYPTTGATEKDLAELAAFRKEIDRWTEWRDSQGRRAFTIPTRLASDDAAVRELDEISISQWLKDHGWTSSRLHWLVDYSCRDDYGLSTERTSAWAGLLYFAARQSGPGADHQPLITWPEGNGRVIQYLASLAGQRLKTHVAVSQISLADDGSVEVIWFNTQTNEVGGLRAKYVVFAAPQFMAPRLITGFSERTGRGASEFRYGSWLVANLHLKSRPREGSFPMSWDNVIHDSRSLGYVVATHQSGQDQGPTVLTWYYPYSDDEPRGVRERLLRATWADLADVALTDLERAHPEIRQLTTRLDLFLWGHAMISPRLGFFTCNQRRQAIQPDGPIHFAHTDLSGIALFEEAFDHGCRAADEILELRI